MIYRAYYTLIVRHERGEPWSIEFGDYDREVAVAERNDWLDHYHDDGRKHRRVDSMVITTDHTQAAIEARVAELNERNA